MAQGSNAIGKDVIEAAIDRLRQQPIVPKSPGLRTADGRLCLCAAAALARAGLEMSNRPSRLEDFDQQILLDGNYLNEVFRALDWSVEFCDRVRADNDQTAETDRRARMVHLLSQLEA